ncbi:MAG TPA: DUF2279 domain-containing protein [Chryseosolibacter sp.]|nr:DUF2279 domain-containing protein [Chryseosolibacter sp.]
MTRAKIISLLLKRVIASVLFVLILFPVLGQPNDSSKNIGYNTRLNTFVIGGSAAYATGMIGLHQLWYKDSKQQRFTIFNDNAEWKQVDKLGHAFSSFYIASGTQRALLWAGVDEKKANIYGALTGFLTLVPIEIFDSYAADYGGSPGDLLADAAGSILFYSQQALWNETRIYPRFSYRPSSYAGLRPNILGDDNISRIFKDYNGQTYWLSFDMDKFARFPKWVNLSVGYGADAMVYARDHENARAGFSSYRQLYLALDVDLTAFRSRSKTLNTLIYLANMIRLPAPTIEFSERGTRFHAFFF